MDHILYYFAPLIGYVMKLWGFPFLSIFPLHIFSIHILSICPELCSGIQLTDNYQEFSDLAFSLFERIREALIWRS